MTTPNPYKRASTGASLYSTPSSREIIAMLGGESYQGGTISRDEQAALVADYEYDLKHDPQGQDKFQLAGAQLYMAREASADGLRVMAWLARFLRPGDDPVQFVAQLAANAGMDTRGDELLDDDMAGAG